MSAETHISPYLVELEGLDSVPVDPKQTDVSLEHVRGDLYLIRYNGKTATLIMRVQDRRNVEIWIRNRLYKALVLDHRDQLLSAWGVSGAGVGAMNDLKSPMPGLVLSVAVSPGDMVVAGQPLVVLEAMKMENELCAAADGLVSAVPVREGQAVAKGEVLIAFEPVPS